MYNINKLKINNRILSIIENPGTSKYSRININKGVKKKSYKIEN